MKVMQNEKSGMLETSYAETSFQIQNVWIWKKNYYLTTTEKGKDKEQINKNLPKEIKTALGKSKTINSTTVKRKTKRTAPVPDSGTLVRGLSNTVK